MEKGQALVILGALVLGSCSGTTREGTLGEILRGVNTHQEISEVIASLPLSRGAMLGAIVSHSAQSSEGKLSNPRFIVELSDGTLVTVLLEGDSIEIGIPNQTASEPLPSALPKSVGNISRSPGELLGEMHPFPRGAHRFTARETLNRWEGSSDSHRCTDCHVDVTTTKGAYGQVPVVVGDEKFSALVSPTSFDEEPDDVLCVPRDLQLLHRCRCENSHEAGCAPFPPLGPEGCHRIEAVLALNPRQSPRYVGKCLVP